MAWALKSAGTSSPDFVANTRLPALRCRYSHGERNREHFGNGSGMLGREVPWGSDEASACQFPGFPELGEISPVLAGHHFHPNGLRRSAFSSVILDGSLPTRSPELKFPLPRPCVVRS